MELTVIGIVNNVNGEYIYTLEGNYYWLATYKYINDAGEYMVKCSSRLYRRRNYWK